MPKLVINPPNPALGVKERAELDCGCHVWVGMRLDNHQTATLANPCSHEHEGLMQHFNLLLAESTVEPLDEELVVVCDRLLAEARQHHPESPAAT